MARDFSIGPYDPCPCGSGEKYKFCCAARAKENRHGKFPVGTVAYYGPDDKVTTKIAASVILREDAEPIIERFVATNVLTDPKVAEQIKQFFAKHGVKSVVITDGNLGCPHEEGLDFPRGSDCPHCPFWAGKQGSERRDEPEANDILNEDDADFDIGDVDDDEERASIDFDASFARVEEILGEDSDDLDFGQVVAKLCANLQAKLTLPCEVTGSEDFQWEEPYVFGAFDQKEYRELKKTQPSYEDRYELLAIDDRTESPWMMFPGEDIAAHVRRKTDGKMFVLGLTELKATDETSPNHQLIEDYGVWFVNSR